MVNKSIKYAEPSKEVVDFFTEEHNSVTKPIHYTYGDVQPIEYSEQVCQLYPPEIAIHIFNVIKYISRAPLKNGVEDLDKAKFYLDRAINNINSSGTVLKLEEQKGH